MAGIGSKATLSIAGSAWDSPVVVMNIGDITREAVDVTHLDSPVDASGVIWKEFVPGPMDGGELTLTSILDTSDPPPIAEVPQPATILFPDSTTYVCTIFNVGNTTNFEQGRMDTEMTFKATLDWEIDP